MVANILLSWRVILLGLTSWALPFALSFLFFDQTGKVTIPLPLFKSLMVVIGGGIGIGLLVLAFRRVQPILWSGLVIGFYWLAMNLILDLLVLLPMSGMGFADYVYDIGLRYLLLPIMATAMGVVAQQSS